MPNIEVQGAEIAVIEAGSGEPVVLLHSSACSALQWRSLIDDLKGRYRVLAPDLFGYGASQAWPGAHRLRLCDEAEIVEALVAGCGGPFHLVGHSYGGAVALRAALERPGELLSLTLIEPVSFHLLWNSDPQGLKVYREVRELADAVWMSVTAGNYRAAMQRFVDYWNGEGAWEQLEESQRRGVLRAAPKLALDFWAALTEPKLLDDYRAIETPTLLLCGTRSPASTRRITELLGNSLPDTSLRVLAGAGHMLPLSHREAANEAIADHIASCSRFRHRAA